MHSNDDFNTKKLIRLFIFGLAMAWVTGWRQGKQLYQRFYEEELLRLQAEFKKTVKETVEETIEEKVQKALRARWR